MKRKFKKYRKYSLLLCWTTLSLANIYQTRDAAGNPYFSDMLSADATMVNLKDINTYTSTPAILTAKEAKNTDNTANGIYKNIAIVQPGDQQTFQNEVNVKAIVTIEPKLQVEDKIEWLLDDKLYQRSQQLEVVFLALDRGEHTAQAKIINAANKPLLASPVVTFYIHRAVAEQQ